MRAVFLFCFVFICPSCSWRHTIKRGNRITGIDAVREVKKTQEVLLDQEEVNQIVKEYLDYNEKSADQFRIKRNLNSFRKRCIAHGICHGKNR